MWGIRMVLTNDNPYTHLWDAKVNAEEEMPIQASGMTPSLMTPKPPKKGGKKSGGKKC